MGQVKSLEGRLTEAESSREKLRNIIRKLKEDRTHYRSLAEKTRYVELRVCVATEYGHLHIVGF